MSGSSGSEADVTGVVLAGGAGARFEGDKTLVEVEGVPLVARVARALADVPVKALVVASGTPQRAFAHTASLVDLDVPVRAVPDLDPSQPLGPLAGLAAALPACRSEWVAVAPGDAPFLSPALYRLLVDEARGHGTAAALETADGPHPLLAVARTDALSRTVREAWVLGERSLRVVLEAIGYAPVAEDAASAVDPGLTSLAVVHTRDDLEELGE